MTLHALNIGTQIAAAMGAPWEAFGNSTFSGIVEDDARYCYLAQGRDTDGLRLTLRADRHDDKVAVHVGYLQFMDADGKGQTLYPSDFTEYMDFKKQPAPCVKLTPTRGAAALAREIQRRVVEPAALIWQRMIDRRDGMLRHARDVDAARQVLLKSGALDGRLSCSHGKFCVNGADSVQIELNSVPLALATQIATLIKENRS